MFTTLFSLSLVLALVHFAIAQSGFTIDTPTFVQCQSANITWTSTANPPYDLLIVPADDPCGPALEDLGNQTSTSVNWNVNLRAGTQVVLSLMDAAGGEAWSGTITVGNSNDASCLTSTPTPSGTAPTVHSSGGVATPASASSPTSSAFAPAGAAGAGVVHTSGALSMPPFSAVTLLGSAVLAVVAFTL